MNELKKIKKELAELKAEYEEFAYVVSHDFKAPFRQIEGFAKIIEERKSDEFDDKTKRHFGLIIKGAEKCQFLINSLLEHSRLNTLAEPFEKIDCNEVWNEVVKRLEEKISTTNAQITCASLPTIVGDKNQITQLFYHLLDNALKFYPDGNTPIISIDVEKNEFHWRFSIRDNGIGIEEKQLSKIFVVLRRAVGDDEYPGTGMGLALAKKIVQRHGGTIEAETELKSGVAFHFTIDTNLQQKESA